MREPVELAIVSALGLLGVGLLATRRAAALSGALLAMVFWALGILGGAAWNWSRQNNGSGLPGSVSSEIALDSVAVQALLFASIGASIGGTVVALILKTPRLRFASAYAFSNGQSNALLATSSIALCLWLLGQGPSVVSRDVYLQTDGIDALERLTAYFAPLAGTVCFAIALLATQLRWRLLHAVLGIAWWGFLLATGTRFAVAIPLAVVAVMIIRLRAVKRLSRLLVSLCIAGVAVFLAIVTFQITLLARQAPHGLMGLIDLFGSPSIPSVLDPSTWVEPLQRFVSSVTASVPIIRESALHPPPANVIWTNANPLPTSLVAVDAFSAERLWPLDWVPLSFVGEVYGIYGPLFQIAFFAIVAALAGVSMAIAARGESKMATLAILALTVLLAIVVIQYPSRNAWRIAWTIVAAPLITAAAIRFLQKRKLRQAMGTQVPAHPRRA